MTPDPALTVALLVAPDTYGQPCMLARLVLVRLVRLAADPRIEARRIPGGTEERAL